MWTVSWSAQSRFTCSVEKKLYVLCFVFQSDSFSISSAAHQNVACPETEREVITAQTVLESQSLLLDQSQPMYARSCREDNVQKVELWRISDAACATIKVKAVCMYIYKHHAGEKPRFIHHSFLQLGEGNAALTLKDFDFSSSSAAGTYHFCTWFLTLSSVSCPSHSCLQGTAFVAFFVYLCLMKTLREKPLFSHTPLLLLALSVTSVQVFLSPSTFLHSLPSLGHTCWGDITFNTIRDGVTFYQALFYPPPIEKESL